MWPSRRAARAACTTSLPRTDGRVPETWREHYAAPPATRGTAPCGHPPQNGTDNPPGSPSISGSTNTRLIRGSTARILRSIRSTAAAVS